MTKPNYAVLNDKTILGTYATFPEALSALKDKGGSVYKRMVTEARASTDHTAALLKSLKWAMSHLQNVTLLAESQDEEAYAEARATIEAVEKYEREVATTGEEAE